jgi:uncharacterized RDD family membrane protein YckC
MSQATCAECFTEFDESEMVKYGDQHVCGSCKSTFFQRVKEGVHVDSTSMDYKGFWIRFAATFIDGIITNLAQFAIMFVLGMAMGTMNDPSQMGEPSATQMIMSVLIILVSIVISVGYEVYFIGKFGATWGKMACNVKVVKADGSPVGYGLATGRFFAKIISGIILGIGYIMAAFDEEKRSLHDRICNTRVVARN